MWESCFFIAFLSDFAERFFFLAIALKDTSGNYIWRHSDDTILGLPVFTSPHMPDMEAGAKPILFGDFTLYWIVECGGIVIKRLREKYAAMGLTGFMGACPFSIFDLQFHTQAHVAVSGKFAQRFDFRAFLIFDYAKNSHGTPGALAGLKAVEM